MAWLLRSFPPHTLDKLRALPHGEWERCKPGSHSQHGWCEVKAVKAVKAEALKERKEEKVARFWFLVGRFFTNQNNKTVKLNKGTSF